MKCTKGVADDCVLLLTSLSARGDVSCRDDCGWNSVRGGEQQCTLAEVPEILLSTTNMQILRRQTQLQKGSVKVSSHSMLCLLEIENKHPEKR